MPQLWQSLPILSSKPALIKQNSQRARKQARSPKKNDKADIKQYRPISLLNNVSKVFEKVSFERLYPPIVGTLSDSQHGFRKKRSAVLQLHLFTDELYQQLESKKCNDIRTLYVDFRKSFDKVTHKKLIQKLKGTGPGGKLLQLSQKPNATRQNRSKQIKDQKCVLCTLVSNLLVLPPG